MANIRDTSAVAEKWSRVTPQRTQDYIAGVQNPRRDWQQAATAAQENYKAAVTQAASQGRYGKGIAAAGTAKWQANTAAKGQTRFGEGVQLGAAAFQAGFEPFRQTIASTTLPPRFPKGDPRNLERVRVLALALNKKKMGT